MPDDPQDPLKRLRQQIEAQLDSGFDVLSRLQSMFTRSVNMHGHFRLPSTLYQDEPNPQIDTVLDQNVPSSAAHHLELWHAFLRDSPYSPLVLDQKLPAPRPKSSGDAEEVPVLRKSDLLGSWRDPFEDLLAASSGLPMTRLDTRQIRRARFADFWMEEPAELWLARLHSQRMSEVYLPVRDTNYVTPRTIDEWVQQRRKDAETADQGFKQGLARLGLDLDEVKKLRDKWTKEDGEVDNKAMPQTEQDLFDFLAPVVREDTPLAALFKSFTGRDDVHAPKPSPKSLAGTAIWHSDKAEAAPNEAGLNTNTVTREWVENGYHHTKTVIRKESADGQQVSEQTSYTKRYVGSNDQMAQKALEPAKKHGGNDETSQGSDVKDDDKKKGSWLWK